MDLTKYIQEVPPNAPLNNSSSLALPAPSQPNIPLNTRQNSLLTIYTIEGVIKMTKILQNKTNLFTVSSVTSFREYKIICTYFCPARKGDVIRGICVEVPSQTGQFQFCQDPVVEPASSPEAIKSTFIIYLKGTKYLKATADKLYRFFEDQAISMIDEWKNKRLTSEDEESPIVRNKEHLSSAVMEVISMYARRFRTNEDVILPMCELGISEKQAKILLVGWYKSFSLRRLYLLGLTQREIRESCDRGWIPDTLYYQLLENPYIPEKVSFEKAENIAKKYQLTFDQNMIESASLVRFVDNLIQNKGWACYPVYGIMQKYPRFSELQPTLKKHFRCAIRYNFFYLKHHVVTEDNLTKLLKSKELNLTYCSETTRNRLSEEQIVATELALNNRVSIITGGAGTGKTTVISAICEELELRDENYLVASFTGKAVARIKEVIRRTEKVMTLHMILAKGNLPELTTLIVDEISMVPNELLYRVLSRLTEITESLRIVLVGDSNQVQPIEWGDLFNQLLNSRQIPTHYLTQDHRRISDGVLFRNMREFGLAETPDEILFSWGKDCILEKGYIPEILSLAKSIFQSGIDHSDITIISPFNDKLEEVNENCLNIFIDAASPLCVDAFGKTWKLGSRVMMTTNRYDINVMNGEEGIITGIFPEKIKVHFKHGEEVFIPTFEPVIMDDKNNGVEEQALSTKMLVLSWAITIHKSQGSEWKYVIFWLPEKRGQYGFLNRKLLYTGISRTRECLYVVAPSEEKFKEIILIDPPFRYDNLEKRLCGEPYADHYVDPGQAKIKAMMETLSVQ